MSRCSSSPRETNDDTSNCDEDEEAYEDPGDVAAKYGVATHEIVVWTSTLTSDANYGYSELSHRLPRLTKACGIDVEGLAHAAEVLRDARERGDAFYDLCRIHI